MNSPAMDLTRPSLSEGGIKLRQQRALWVVLASLLILAPVLIYGIPSNIDLSNHFRFAIPFNDSLQSGRLYPGWLAESNSGYGDPSFRFYPPGTYYLLAGARMLAGNWFGGSVIAFGVMFVVGSLGIYLWARELVNGKTAMWAGILYAVAPYRLNELYQAFLLAEFAGAAVLPFTFLFTERVCARGRLRDMAGLAASYAILVLTHLPLTVIGSIALVLYAIIRLKPRQQWTRLLLLGFSAALGLAASATYWTTMISELDWIRADNIDPYSFVDYRSNFLLSTFSPENLNVWWMNILLLSTLAMFWPGFVVFRKSVWKNCSSRGIKAAGILLLITLVMATQLSTPIWRFIRPLQETQFPWRWLAVTSLVCPLLFAAALPYWVRLWRENKRPLVLIAAGTLAISLAFSFSHIIREAQYLKQPEFNATLRAIPGSQGVKQWWPRWVNEPIREMKQEVEAGSRVVAVKSWQPESRMFSVEAGEARDVRIRTFYYPHWRATSDNESLPVRPDSDGAMIISIPSQSTTVLLEFREPSHVRWIRFLSIMAWVVIAGLVWISLHQRKTSQLVEQY